MRTSRIDQYICLDVDQIVIDEMEYQLSFTLGRNDMQEDRDYLAKTKRAARVIISMYTVPSSRFL